MIIEEKHFISRVIKSSTKVEHFKCCERLVDIWKEHYNKEVKECEKQLNWFNKHFNKEKYKNVFRYEQAIYELNTDLIFELSKLKIKVYNLSL